jgi:hypothetical protein
MEANAEGAIVVLQGAHELLSSGWCQGADARDASGRAVEPWDDRATEWSLLGAVVAQTEPALLESGELTVGVLRRAVGALAEVLTADSLSEWNDDPDRDAGDVADILVQAIARLDALGDRRSTG